LEDLKDEESFSDYVFGEPRYAVRYGSLLSPFVLTFGDSLILTSNPNKDFIVFGLRMFSESSSSASANFGSFFDEGVEKFFIKLPVS